MHQVGTTDPWLFRYGFNMMVDFCVWVLEQDGLQVDPFNAHPEGDRTLRSAGLQAQEWRLWTDKVVQLQHQQAQALPQQVQGGLNPSSFILPDAHNPPASWPGSAGVRARLDQLWEQYKPLSNARRSWERPLAKQWRPIAYQLWQDLQPYQVRLPALTLHLVEYPRLVEYVLPPVSVILTIVDNQLSGEDFRLRVLHAAESLAIAQNK